MKQSRWLYNFLRTGFVYGVSLNVKEFSENEECTDKDNTDLKK